MPVGNLRPFAFPTYAALGEKLAPSLGIPLGQVSVDRFPNHEVHFSLTSIVLGAFTTAGAGIVPALIGISVVGLVMVLVNALFNYVLFNVKS